MYKFVGSCDALHANGLRPTAAMETSRHSPSFNEYPFKSVYVVFIFDDMANNINADIPTYRELLAEHTKDAEIEQIHRDIYQSMAI